jgi:hypothetical protein
MQESESATDPGQRALLRHTIATLAYRGGKTLRDVPAGFGQYKADPSARTPGAILAHLNDLLDWAVLIARGGNAWHDSTPGDWDADAARFHDGLARLDAILASDVPLGCPPGQLFQGPIADALTHVGQLAMLRRMAGGPIRGENYFKADIVTGRVGPDQAAPRREFD